MGGTVGIRGSCWRARAAGFAASIYRYLAPRRRNIRKTTVAMTIIKPRLLVGLHSILIWLIRVFAGKVR